MPFAFQVTDPDGHPVTRYTEAHEKELHLIVVRRDLSGFQHVHPVLSDGELDGRPRPGPGRLATGRTPTSSRPTSGTTWCWAPISTSPATTRHVALPAPATTTTVDGYDVTLAGDPEPGGRDAS